MPNIIGKDVENYTFQGNFQYFDQGATGCQCQNLHMSIAHHMVAAGNTLWYVKGSMPSGFTIIGKIHYMY